MYQRNDPLAKVFQQKAAISNNKKKFQYKHPYFSNFSELENEKTLQRVRRQQDMERQNR